MDPILLIDDDPELCHAMSEYLTPKGFCVETANDGDAGLEMALSGKYVLVVLAQLPPGVQTGFDLLRRLRVQSNIPVVMLTPRVEDVDRILSLEMGADDCLSKPFSPRELLARIRAILRRVRGGSRQQQPPMLAPALRVGDVYLEPARRVVRQGAVPLELTAAEFGVLEILVRNAGQVVRREELVERVLGRRLSAKDRSIDTHISRLRKKLGRAGRQAKRIKTIRNIGYLYLLPPESDSSRANPGAEVAP